MPSWTCPSAGSVRYYTVKEDKPCLMPLMEGVNFELPRSSNLGDVLRSTTYDQKRPTTLEKRY